ncbi:class I SAM-dependent methyltransferase [uncultured Corynebacterium sp.]|uniref:class I SAM-dependent methyltransferase n=1 Tax=uncultured Corynebacterium sp. TaxID=159447 RepID=UPI0025CC3B6C|nr:class I SAM-dependent methyltransferase [uncultured Corynebacterium sp.]
MANHAHNLRPGSWTGPGPRGVVTRGTTNVNRLRRCDRWAVHHPGIRAVLRGVDEPLAVDVGYGASHATTCEWAARLRTVRPDLAVTGLEIDPERVLPDRDGVHFALGGFELAGLRPHLVRAFNVLRQYDAADVDAAWREVTGRMADGGLFIEGTCDELGRRSAWVLLDASGPRTLTMAWDPMDVAKPSDLAERLPKTLIHRNVPGEPIHALLADLDRAWDVCAGWAPYGPRIRWRQAMRMLRDEGLPLGGARRPVRDNVVTVPFGYVAPEYADGFA